MLDNIFQLAPLPHVVLDAKGNILITNTAAKQSLSSPDSTASTLLQTPLADLIHTADRTRYRDWLTDQPDNLSALVVRLQNAEPLPDYVQLHSRHTSETVIISMTPLAEESVRSLLAEEEPDSTDVPRHFVSSDTRRQLDTSEIQQIRATEALHDSAVALTATLDLDTVLDKILENLRQVIDYDRTDIMLIRDETAFVVRSHDDGNGDTADEMDTLHFSIETTPTLRRMQETGDPVLIDDVDAARKEGGCRG